MIAILDIARKIYRTVVPRFVRNSSLVKAVKQAVLPHDAIYNSEYYGTTVEAPAVRSSSAISESIVTDFSPSRVIDVGCGTGALLEAFRQRGCEVFGLEYSKAALEYCRHRQLSVSQFDLEKDVYNDNGIFDVAISMEVAEHLPERVSDRYVDLLSHLSQNIVFTAAPPGQGGTDHVNEQPPSYWIDKFYQRGFDLDERLSNSWREQWKAGGNVESWYYQNLMVFRKSK